MNGNPDFASTLKSIPSFERLEDSRLVSLSSICRLVSLSEGEEAYGEDEQGSDVFFIISGLMEIRMQIGRAHV